MRIWLRIFLLAATVALAAIALTGILVARAGYRAQLDAEVRGLLRVTDAAAALVTNSYRTSAYLSAQPASVTDFIRQLREPIAEGAAVEIYTSDLELALSEGHVEPPPAAGDSPELAAARAGRSTWTLRRPHGDLLLYLALPETVAGDTFLFRASAPLASLDAYGSSQLILLALSALGALVLLCGAALAGSRSISRGLERLSVQATDLAGGNLAARVAVRGSDEVAGLARELNRMADAVETSIRSRQAFIDDLTHELRTPVASIVGFADHLRRRAWDEAVFTEGLTRIYDEGMRVLALSEGLKRLLLARTSARALAEGDVAEVLEQAASDARLRRAGHRFVVHAPAGVRLSMDRDLLLAALANLLDNAARASPPGATVSIEWVQDAASRRIVVRDPGGVEGPLEPGLGLGKSICREIADYHGARLQYAPAEGGGTAASIVFPNLH